MIVADTTLLANFYLGDKQEEAMVVFRLDAEWFASPLWRFEMHHTLLKHIRARQFPVLECESVMTKASALLADRERQASTTQVLQAAMIYKISAYGADYLALAQQLRVPLVTFDQKLVRAAPGLALLPADFIARS
jgi:predicted nucleic acid-binding protein